MSDKKYNIYLKNKCIYDSLSKSEFEDTWKMLTNLTSIFGNVTKEDLSYKQMPID